MTTPAVHSEDDNFIIGTGDNFDRLRRDARQLHLSKHNETRSKAHFARYRNAALKCSMVATHKQVDHERSLTLRELERAQMETHKRQQKYQSKKISYLPNISPKAKYTPNTVDTKASKTTINKKALNNERHLQIDESRQDISWMSSKTASSVDAIKKVRLDKRTPTSSSKTKVKTAAIVITDNDELSSQASAPPWKRGDTLGSNSDVSLALSGVSSTTKEQLQSSFKTYRFSQSERGLYRTSSSRSLRIYPGDLNVRRSNSCDHMRSYFEREKKKEDKIWQDFDGLLKWFADYLDIEHKPSFVVKDCDEAKDAHARQPRKKKVVIPKSSMSPLYFRHGVPEDCVVRLC